MLCFHVQRKCDSRKKLPGAQPLLGSHGHLHEPAEWAPCDLCMQSCMLRVSIFSRFHALYRNKMVMNNLRVSSIRGSNQFAVQVVHTPEWWCGFRFVGMFQTSVQASTSSNEAFSLYGFTSLSPLLQLRFTNRACSSLLLLLQFVTKPFEIDSPNNYKVEEEEAVKNKMLFFFSKKNRKWLRKKKKKLLCCCVVLCFCVYAILTMQLSHTCYLRKTIFLQSKTHTHCHMHEENITCMNPCIFFPCLAVACFLCLPLPCLLNFN